MEKGIDFKEAMAAAGEAAKALQEAWARLIPVLEPLAARVEAFYATASAAMKVPE